MKKIISRYLSSDTFQAAKRDLGFLIEKIEQSGFEYGLQIRDDYLNLYYKGNSLGKISYRKSKDLYEVRIHRKFAKGIGKTGLKRPDDSDKSEKGYSVFTVTGKQLRSLFSSRNLLLMGQKVKDVGFQEEIVFEQMLMTDNVDRDDLVIIDRQVVDRNSSTKMDLLAVKRNDAGNYQFCILEVKLGNNLELKEEVSFQLAGYIKRIEENFDAYKDCYEKNISQKQELGLLRRDLKVNIVDGVLGFVVVGGYSGLAKKSTAELKSRHPGIKVIPIENKIDFSKVQ